MSNDTLIDFVIYLDEIFSKFKVDTKRIHMSGQSMRGSSVWYFLGENPDFFANAIPVCGRTYLVLEKVHLLLNLPIWAFYGAYDIMRLISTI